MRVSWLFVVLCAVAAGCKGENPDGIAGAPGDGDSCDVMPPQRCENDTRWGDIEPIIQERCVGCHAGVPGGPWSLVSYSHASAWPTEIREVMLDCAMPPPDAGVEMPTSERQALLDWVRCGVRQ